MSGSREAASRRENEIKAAVAGFVSANSEVHLPPQTVRLLCTMFPAGNVCQRSLDAIAKEGFDRRHLLRLLRRLVDAGLLSKEPGSGSVPTTYRLHLPPVRR